MEHPVHLCSPARKYAWYSLCRLPQPIFISQRSSPMLFPASLLAIKTISVFHRNFCDHMRILKRRKRGWLCSFSSSLDRHLDMFCRLPCFPQYNWEWRHIEESNESFWNRNFGLYFDVDQWHLELAEFDGRRLTKPDYKPSWHSHEKQIIHQKQSNHCSFQFQVQLGPAWRFRFWPYFVWHSQTRSSSFGLGEPGHHTSTSWTSRFQSIHISSPCFQPVEQDPELYLRL